MKENFNEKEYRDNLAKDLKDIRKTDPEMAQKVLEEERETTRYKLALPEIQKIHKDKKEKEKIQKDIIEDSIKRISGLSSIELFENKLKEAGIPFNYEKSISNVLEDGKLEVKGEIVDTNIFKTHLRIYSSDRRIIITPNDLYIEIVPGPVSNHEDYRVRFNDQILSGEFSGKDIDTVILGDGVGIVVKNTNLYQKEIEKSEIDEKELKDKINELIHDRLEKKVVNSTGLVGYVEALNASDNLKENSKYFEELVTNLSLIPKEHTFSSGVDKKLSFSGMFSLNSKGTESFGERFSSFTKEIREDELNKNDQYLLKKEIESSFLNGSIPYSDKLEMLKEKSFLESKEMQETILHGIDQNIIKGNSDEDYYNKFVKFLKDEKLPQNHFKDRKDLTEGIKEKLIINGNTYWIFRNLLTPIIFQCIEENKDFFKNDDEIQNRLQKSVEFVHGADEKIFKDNILRFKEVLINDKKVDLKEFK